jgi:hypothetical protein
MLGAGRTEGADPQVSDDAVDQSQLRGEVITVHVEDDGDLEVTQHAAHRGCGPG